ncbi:uncharacterized protein LOC117111090 [Anneissia japonica]|uniref:uncharacterized protein LOC117111090 n=1 Tax=Anneissia japonica TaxID=1529436 RepID=UPI0014256BF2|nr:uncharacterized protein LOC117111090 [Anneissia japonica]
MATSCQNEYDFYVISDDEDWENKVIIELQKRRQGLRCYSKRDHIPGKPKLENFIDGVNKCKKVVVGFTSTLSTGYLMFVTENAVQKMVDNNIIGSGKVIPVKITQDAIIPDILNIFSPADGWEDSFYEKLLDEKNMKMKLVEKQPEAGLQNQENSDSLEHLKRFIESIRNVKVSEVPYVKRIMTEASEYFLANGIDIRGVNIGSIIFSLFVYDTKSLMNLWDMHLSGQLIKDLAKILVPEDLQELFLEKWMTEIDEAEYKSTLSKLIDKHLKFKSR